MDCDLLARTGIAEYNYTYHVHLFDFIIFFMLFLLDAECGLRNPLDMALKGTITRTPWRLEQVQPCIFPGTSFLIVLYYGLLFFVRSFVFIG